MFHPKATLPLQLFGAYSVQGRKFDSTTFCRFAGRQPRRILARQVPLRISRRPPRPSQIIRHFVDSQVPWCASPTPTGGFPSSQASFLDYAFIKTLLSRRSIFDRTLLCWFSLSINEGLIEALWIRAVNLKYNIITFSLFLLHSVIGRRVFLITTVMIDQIIFMVLPWAQNEPIRYINVWVFSNEYYIPSRSCPQKSFKTNVLHPSFVLRSSPNSLFLKTLFLKTLLKLISSRFFWRVCC